MRFSKQFLFLILVAAFASCKHGSTNDNATTTVNGRINPKGTTSYNYGTHLVTTSAYNAYLVESTSINLDSYDGDSVQVVMKDMGIRQNPGPELYNVIQITPL